MKKQKMYRQGDVLIEKVAKLPPNLNLQKATNGRIILALGEATGHHHSLAADPADWWKQDKTGEQFLTVKEATTVEHQEHAPITLPPGNYRVRRQREYTPEVIRNVRD